MPEGESGSAARAAGFELRLEPNGAFVALAPQPLAPGVDLVDLSMEAAGVAPPFDVAAGAAQFRHLLCDLDRLELSVADGGLALLASRLCAPGARIVSLALALRGGFVEGAGGFDGGGRFTFKAALLPAGDGALEVVVYEPLVYPPSSLCAALVPALLAGAAPEVAVGAEGRLFLEPLRLVLRRLLPRRGWKVPRSDAVRVAKAEIRPAALELAWDRVAAAPVPAATDLLAAVEGARAFADGERHLAAGDLPGARDAYLAIGDAAAAHPFGAARLLSLLAADAAGHDQALALAEASLARWSDFAPALAATALVRAARGEKGASARPLADLAAVAARRGEEYAALEAAEACLALGVDSDRDAQARAAETALTIRRDHLPALRALLALGERADPDALLRACRRLAAYAPESGEKARAHARLGALLLANDPPAARLHLDHALRLGSSDPDALAAVVAACADSGEHLRAVRALDRLRELALARGDPAAAATAALEIADLWERAGQHENALLRCREACALFPSAEAEELAARLSDGLARPDEAAAHREKLLGLLDARVDSDRPRLARARGALAEHAERLGDHPTAAAHLEAALALAPDDIEALRRLVRLLARVGGSAERRAALDRLALLTSEPVERARLLAEAARLSGTSPDEARSRWEEVLKTITQLASTPSAADESESAAGAAALEVEALEAIAPGAAAQGDREAEERALARLAELAAPGAARAAALDRLSSAREQAGDLGGALAAAGSARAQEASLTRLESEVRLARRARDEARLAALLPELASATHQADPSRAARARLEQARVLARSGELAQALAEAGEASRLDPGCAEALELVAELAAGRDPETEASALLARAELARRGGEGDLAERLAAAGQAAISAGRGDEGEAALREALALGLSREEARAAWAAVADRAARRGDAAAEREAIAALVPLLPTGARPAALLRLSGLSLAAGDCAEARRAAEAARKLAPRDPAAAEACRAAAEAAGDAAAVPDLLAELAALEPARAGALQLERARRLAALGRAAEADRAMLEALGAAEPDAALAEEHARARREGPPDVRVLPWSEPLERFAQRATDRLAAARALGKAAVMALEQGDRASALRCARGAFARTQEDDPGFAGPLLADVLYRSGAVTEALALHGRLLEAGLPGCDDAAGAALCRQLAELSEEAGDGQLALRALDRLLELQPHAVEGALRRFELDPDRGRATRRLADAASGTRVARLRSDALARAAFAAAAELHDAPLSEALFAKARAVAGDYPPALARVQARRVEAARARLGAAPSQVPALLEALADLAAARDGVGDAAGAGACLEEAATLAAQHGLRDHALGYRLAMERRAIAAGDGVGAGRHARVAGILLLERGDAEGAEAALRRAVARASDDLDAWRALEAAGRARGELGIGTVVEALLARAALDPGDTHPRREAARILLAQGRAREAELHLRALLRADPRDAATAQLLGEALADRPGERAEATLLRASAASGPARAALLREAWRDFRTAREEARAREALRAAFDAEPTDDESFLGALRDASDDVVQLDAVLAARARAVAADAAGCHRARGDALFACGRPDDALDAYVACLEHAPDDPDVLAHVASAVAARDGDDAAAAHDERIVALAEGEPGAIAPGVEARSRERLGLSASRQGRAADTARHLSRALALAPDALRSPAALAALVEARASLGDDEGALAAGRRLAECAPTEDARREALERGAALAARCGDRGPDAAALLEGLAALQLSRDAGASAEALAERAVDALVRAGENARAAALVARAARTAQGPRRAVWLKRLAEAAAARGDRAAARAAREEALAADPSDVALRDAHLADVEASGDAGALSRALEAALSAPGADVVALSLRRARALDAAGDAAGAERCFAAVVDLGPSSDGWVEAVGGLSALLEVRGDLRGLARLELARAEACQEPHARASALLAASNLLERAGDLAAAREACERARDVDPDDAAPWLALSRLARAAGDADGAARALLAVAIRCEGMPSAEAAVQAADLLAQSGRPDEAQRALLAAVAAVPGLAAARRALADRAREAGDAAAVAQHLAALDTSELAAEEQHAHQRALARALSEAGDAGAEAVWASLFDADPSDDEAFQRLARIARGRDAEAWLALAARHEGALSGISDVGRRRDLRCQRAALLSDLGRLDAADGAWQAALALDPRHRGALRGLRALLERRGDHGRAADMLAAEAAAAEDPAEQVELLLDEARLRLEKLGDRARAASILDSILTRVEAPPERLARLRDRVEALRSEVGQPERDEGSTSAPAGDASPAAPASDADAPEHNTLSFSAIEDGAAPEARPGQAPEALPSAVTGGQPSQPREPALDRDGGQGLLDDDDPAPAVDERLRALAAAAVGADRARYLERVAARLERRGDRAGAADALLGALEADPANPERFERAASAAAADRDRLVAAHRLRVRGAASPAARADALRQLGQLLAASPETLAEAVEVLERASALAPTSGATAAALGTTLLALGHPSRAFSVLSLFQDGAPDLPAMEVSRLIALAAESSGGAPAAAHGDAADALPGAVVPRAEPVGQAGRAGAASDAGSAALEEALRRVRAAPLDVEALRLASTAAAALARAAPAEDARRLHLLARAADGTAAFSAGDDSPSGVAPVALAVARDARSRAAHPTARTALARLLALLAPYLEGLFPVDLARRGVSGQLRVGPRRAPELLASLEHAQRALGTRPFAAFLADEGGCEIAVENTQPPSIVLGAGVAAAGEAERRFLLARGLALVDLGWALAGKFAPRDVAILCDLACRFAGAAASRDGLPDDRAQPFLEGLARLVPPTVHDRAQALGAEAARDLAGLAPRDLTAALRQTASRLALLHTGDAGAALSALAAAEPRLRGLARAEALSHPDLRDLAAFALSEVFLELRAAAEGGA